MGHDHPLTWLRTTFFALLALNKIFSSFIASLGSAYYYRPQTNFAKVMFSQVSVCRQRGCGRHPRGRHPLVDTTLGRHPPADTPQAETPWPDPRADGQQVGGTHPTHSCFCNILLIFKAQIQKFSSHFTQYITSQLMQIESRSFTCCSCFHICFGVLGVLLTAC